MRAEFAPRPRPRATPPFVSSLACATGGRRAGVGHCGSWLLSSVVRGLPALRARGVSLGRLATSVHPVCVCDRRPAQLDIISHPKAAFPVRGGVRGRGAQADGGGACSVCLELKWKQGHN